VRRSSETKGRHCYSKSKWPDPEIVFDKYLHEISGGQKTTRHDCDGDCLQTAIINADEPTTALDVTVQRNYPVVERHSARNGNEYHILFHNVARFSYCPSLVMYQVKLWSKGK
jgi:peptide/nickel transport system ATP-binding protein